MKNQQNSTVFWAIIFILGGGFFLMKNLGMINFRLPFDLISWRLIPLVIGISALINKNYITGVPLVVLAVVFYIPDFLHPIERQQYYKLWPLLLVGIGVNILIKYYYPQSYKSPIQNSQVTAEDEINEFMLMSGASKKFTSKNFKGGKISCVMAGEELYLNDSALVENSVLEVFVLMGGIEMTIPKEWNLKVNVTPVMGGVEDQITKFPENVVERNKTLEIRGFIMMGGIEIIRV